MDRYKHVRPNPPRARQSIDGFLGAPGPRAQSSRAVYRASGRAQPPAVVPKRRLQDATPATADHSVVDAPAPAKRLPQLDMELPEGAEAHHYTGKFTHRGKLRAARKWAVRCAAVVVALVLLVGGFLFSQGYLKLHKIFNGNAASAASLQANVDPSLLKGEGDGRVNILMLGRGGLGHEAPDLTDTIMLASIDPVNHTAALLSIPRDLWVSIPNAGSMKINAAWETGKYKYLGKLTSSNSNSKAVQAGFNLVDQTVEQVVGVPIHYNFMVDFQAFRQAVDTVGGVNINVPTTLYDPTMAWENGGSSILAKAGPQIFNGKKALVYVRSRETSSDFARAERQRAVLLSLKNKVTTAGTLGNPVKISGLMNAFGNNVQTDLSLKDGTRLYSIFKHINNANVQSLDFTTEPNVLVTTGNINGQSVVMPKAGLSSYSPIQTYVRSKLQDGYIKREHSAIMLLNGTNVPGIATIKATELKSYGYNITNVINAPTNSYYQTVLVDLTHGKDKYTKHYLEQRFNTKAVSKVPDTAIVPGNAHFIIILGNDATSIQD